MGITTLPTNIGGIQLPFNQISGPLASLFTTDRPENLMYPLELGTDPSLCHAVQFSIYDRTSQLVEGLSNTTVNNIVENALPGLLKAAQSGTYAPQIKGSPLAIISLYMPDTLAVNYSSNYSQISMTQTMGVGGMVANSVSDAYNNSSDVKSFFKNLWGGLGKYAATQAAGAASSKYLGTGENLAGYALQAAGVTVNPQLQLLYEGIDLRTFTLEFILTPRSAKEAENIKRIIDTFVYYSSPGISGNGNSGQFLTPPQIFKVKFAFTGSQGIVGALTSAFKSALSNIGLGFLNTSNPTQDISNAANAKIFDINECVLRDINVDYAPNGWAAYNDGYPIQTRLTMTFQEMQIITKDSLRKNMQNNVSVGREDIKNPIKPQATQEYAPFGGD